MEFKLIEPFRTLFKDEVRALGEELGFADRNGVAPTVPRPPAWRFVSSAKLTRERLEVLREADYILIDEIKKAGLYRQIWQCFAALLPTVNSVGVMGDQRTYAHPVVVRAVTSEDGMTSDWARIPTKFWRRLAIAL